MVLHVRQGGRVDPVPPQEGQDRLGTFDVHSDVGELPFMGSPDANEAMGLYLRCGSWTGSHGRQGVVPLSIVDEFSNGRHEPVDLLVEAGLWDRGEDGYRMLRGPSDDPDDGLPLWRYSDDDLGGRLFAVDDTPNT